VRHDPGCEDGAKQDQDQEAERQCRGEIAQQAPDDAVLAPQRFERAGVGFGERQVGHRWPIRGSR
jgi:hypothetical protein